LVHQWNATEGRGELRRGVKRCEKSGKENEGPEKVEGKIRWFFIGVSGEKQGCGTSFQGGEYRNLVITKEAALGLGKKE